MEFPDEGIESFYQAMVCQMLVQFLLNIVLSNVPCIVSVFDLESASFFFLFKRKRKRDRTNSLKIFMLFFIWYKIHEFIIVSRGKTTTKIAILNGKK